MERKSRGRLTGGLILLILLLAFSAFFAESAIPDHIICRDGTNFCISNGSSNVTDRILFYVNRSNGDAELFNKFRSVELFINNSAAECSAGTYMTEFVGNGSTCVAAVRTTGESALTGNYTFGGFSLFIDDANDRLGVGTVLPNRTIHINDTMRLIARSSPPGGATLGDLYVDSDTNTLCFFNSSAWISAAQGGSCA